MQNARNSLCGKQWIIFMRKQWIVLLKAKNRFYECSKQIWIYSKHDVQRANFINVEIDFISAEKEIRLLWNLNMKKHSDLAYKFRKHNFKSWFMRKQWTISKYGVLQLAKKKVAKATFKSSAKHLDIHKKKFTFLLETLHVKNLHIQVW